ncbi:MULTISPECIES: DDE-type integrase/transposase/recombinase [Staphylococcus]
MDETYIKIKGKWSYLYRAIDAEGHTLDIWFCCKVRFIV